MEATYHAMTLSPIRQPHEFYVTPPEGTRALLSVESFEGSVWEPACGNGAIARILSRAGYQVLPTDLIDRGYGEGGVNFLDQTEPRARNIVTNPPYGRGLADNFLRKSFQLVRDTGGTIALLLDLASLAHPLRHGLLVANPPSNVYILDELICQPGGRPRFTEAHLRYAWVLWKPGHRGPAALSWLSTAPFKDRS